MKKQFFEEQLNDAHSRLQRLKANVHTWAIGKYVEELRQNWKPQTKIEQGECIHGSHSGDIVEIVLYYDVYNHVWTSEEQAFKGYVFKKVSERINRK